MGLAWKGEFHGDRHLILRDTVLDLRAKSRLMLYGNILPVVQSSGTGKSRVAREAAGLIFSLTITISKSIGSTGRLSMFDPCGEILTSPKYSI